MSNDNTNQIEIHRVNKKFVIDKKKVDILKDINLEFKKGEFICIVGASGCGKSTLTRLLAGLDKPTSGEVLVDGKKVDKPSVKTGIIFQEARLFPWLSVRKNIEFGIHEKLSPEELREITGGGEFSDVPVVDETDYTQNDRDKL